MSKGQIEKLTAIAQEHGLGGLAYIIVNENDLQSPIIKFLGEDIAAGIISTTDAKVGDIVFFSAADAATANKALDAGSQSWIFVQMRQVDIMHVKQIRPGVDIMFAHQAGQGCAVIAPIVSTQLVCSGLINP